MSLLHFLKGHTAWITCPGCGQTERPKVNLSWGMPALSGWEAQGGHHPQVPDRSDGASSRGGDLEAMRRSADLIARHICDPPRDRSMQMRALAWAVAA